MGVLWNPISDKSSGGTELLCRRLEAGLPPDLLKEVQIIPSRLYGELDETKVRVLYLHDLPNDPESAKILANGGWRKFHKIVAVSQWQMQRYIDAYNIPWSMFFVVPNSIVPIEPRTKEEGDGLIRFIYHTTPHRGLDVLVAVFEKLCEEHKNIRHDVYSSFKIYGWDARDAEYKTLFDRVKAHEAMTYHGSVPNDVVREAISRSDVFAYPSCWPETSCLSLMEAMSAGLLCIHPNFGALAETAANWTMMYQFHEDKNQHAAILHSIIEGFLRSDRSTLGMQLANQKAYADIFYNWDTRQRQWVELLTNLLSFPREFQKEMFSYRA